MRLCQAGSKPKQKYEDEPENVPEGKEEEYDRYDSKYARSLISALPSRNEKWFQEIRLAVSLPACALGFKRCSPRRLEVTWRLLSAASF
jgi:hypothetical protein